MKKELADSFSIIFSAVEILKLIQGRNFIMEEKRLWDVFWQTGNAMDYLSYQAVKTGYREERTGEKKVESEKESDRDDSVSHTYG